MYGLTTGASSLLNWLSGDSDKEKLYKWLMKQANKPASQLGYSPEEKNALRFGIKSRLQTAMGESSRATAASAARRGQRLGPQFYTEQAGRYGKAYSQSIPQIDIESARLGRQRKDQYTNQLVGLGGTMPNNGVADSLSEISSNLMQYFLAKNNPQATGGNTLIPNSQGTGAITTNELLKYLQKLRPQGMGW